MLRAAVPEAAVHEDSHADRPEEDIGATPQAGQGGHVNPIPQAGRVQQPSNGELGTSVASLLALHPATDVFAAGP